MRRLALLLVPLALGCNPEATGESEGEGDDETGGLREPDWAGEYAAAECKLAHVECECSDPLTPSLDECLDFYEQSLEMNGEKAQAAGLIYDGTCAAEAVAWSEQFGCGTWPDLYVHDADCSKCSTPAGVYHGDVAAGAACVTYGHFSDCASGLFCSFGVCVDPCVGYEPPSLGEGETCKDAEFNLLGLCDLNANLRCDFVTGSCVPVPTIGEACPDGYCAFGAHCDPSDVCVESPADGEACPDGQCAGFGSICEAQDQGPAICVPEAIACG
jgi:hypothetical protein